MQVNVKQLVAAIKQATPYKFPEMDEGTAYLYENVYNRLASGKDVLFSDLDFSAFDTEDIRFLGKLHVNIFSKNYLEAGGITNNLRMISPVSKSTVYI